jgi:predicted ATPase
MLLICFRIFLRHLASVTIQLYLTMVYVHCVRIGSSARAAASQSKHASKEVTISGEGKLHHNNFCCRNVCLLNQSLSLNDNARQKPANSNAARSLKAAKMQSIEEVFHGLCSFDLFYVCTQPMC